MISVHSKKTFVRPLCENDFGSIQKKITSTIHPFNKENSDPNALKAMDENKHTQILKMDAAYSGLLSSVEELQKWKASVEMENKQKNKKIESLMQIIETQKKMILELQIQNENLNLQFAEEIQQRTLVSEKLYSTKEMCSALKKHIGSMQGHFECRDQIAGLISAADKKRLQEIDNLRNKLEKLCVEHSEKVEFLTSSLGLEKNRILDLQEKYEQQLGEAENERDALCTMVKNCEKEIANLSTLLEEEKTKARTYEREKNDMESTIFQLETANETNALYLKEKEDALKKAEISKQDLEKQFLSERSQANDLLVKYKELLEVSEVWKAESEKEILNLKKLVDQSNDKILEFEKRLEQEQIKHQDTLCSLQGVKEKNSLLEIQIEESLLKIEGFEKLEMNFKECEEANALLLKEKANLTVLLEDVQKDLINFKIENEQLSSQCAKKSELLSNLKENYENKLVSEADKIVAKQNDYDSLLNALKDMEKNCEEKTQVILNKEESITKLQSMINDKENIIHVLKKENIEIKNDFEGEMVKVKNCEKCEQLSIKIAETEVLKGELEKVKEEMTNKDRSVMDVLLLLQDTEATFNKDRIAKAKEIEDFKKQVRSLKFENDCLKCDKEEFEKLKLLNKDLKEKIEKLNIEILEYIEREKNMENNLQEKSVNQNTEFEAKRNNLHETKMLTDNQDSDVSDCVQNEKSAANQILSNNKKWEIDSSSSDCLELVYDKENGNQARLIKKPKSDFKNNEVAMSSNKESKQLSFLTKRKREIQNVSQEDLVRERFGLPPRKKDGFKCFPSKMSQPNLSNRRNEFHLTSNNKEKQNPSEKMMSLNKKQIFFKKSVEEKKNVFKKLENPRPWF